MHKNKDFGIVSLYSSDWEAINENFSSGSRVLSVLQFLCQVREVSSCQQGALGGEQKQAGDGGHHTWVDGRGLTGGRVWLGTDIPQGNDDLALHSTNKTIQTMLMKCLGSCTCVNSNLFCFFFLPSLLCRVLLPADSPVALHCLPDLFSPAELVH